MRYWNLTLILAMVFVLLIVSGCAGGETPAPEVPPTAVETEAPEATEPEPIVMVVSTETEALPTETEVMVEETAEEEPTAADGAFTLSSPVFEDGGEIPVKHTCWGESVSPELNWNGVPDGTVSYVFLVYDPDAGESLGASTELGFAHWIVYNTPAERMGYPEDMPCGLLDGGCQQGSNDFDQFLSEGATLGNDVEVKLTGYDGPCPPEKHTYVFEINALDTILDLPTGAPLSDVLSAMEGHVLGTAQLRGTFDPGE